ncbi:MAG: hypothetical protein OWU84_11245, partial [Firmicutes bacterium]|nr:hypothetical protein [Bacillota bacterium]
MTVVRAFFRTVVVALAIWGGQVILRPRVNTMGLWAMISLGIAAAALSVFLTRLVTTTENRWMEGMLAFVATSAVLMGFYLVIPKHPVMEGPDLTLSLAVG